MQVNEPIVRHVMGSQPDQFGNPMPVIQAKVVGYNNRLADMTMDIIVDALPDTATLHEEQFQGLTQLAANGFPIPPELIIRASSLPNKRELLEAIEQSKAQPNPEQQAGAAKEGAEVQKIGAEAQLRQAQAAKIQQDMGMRAGMALAAVGPTPGMTGEPPMVAA
jgi:hypothetical protein